jgi:hypothetical protein
MTVLAKASNNIIDRPEEVEGSKGVKERKMFLHFIADASWVI